MVGSYCSASYLNWNNYFYGKALVQIGEPAVPSLLGLLRDSGNAGQYSVLRILTPIGSISAIEAIARYLYDEAVWIRAQALEALVQISDLKVIPILIDLLKNHSRRIEAVIEKSSDLTQGKNNFEITDEEELSLRVVAALKNYGTPEALNAVADWIIEFGPKDS